MPTYDTLIDNFVIGDNLDIVRTVSGIPSGQQITAATLHIKIIRGRSIEYLTKEITTTFSATDGIIDSNSLTFTLSAAETALMIPGTPHYFEVQVTTDANKIYTPEKGVLIGKSQLVG